MELIPAVRRLRAALAAVLVQPERPSWRSSTGGSTPGAASACWRSGCIAPDTISTCAQYGDGHWRASFYVTGLAHSILGGSAWEPTVWRPFSARGGMRCSTPSAICDAGSR